MSKMSEVIYIELQKLPENDSDSI